MALSDIDLTPPKGMVDAAKKGLELREEFGRGGTEVGVRTARRISNNISIDLVKKMYAYHERHQVDKEAEGFKKSEKGFPSAGYIALHLWGFDAGHRWSERKRNEIMEEEQRKLTAAVKEGLENKRDEHNDEVAGMSLAWDAKVSLSMLEKVFDRGVGAYKTNQDQLDQL